MDSLKGVAAFNFEKKVILFKYFRCRYFGIWLKLGMYFKTPLIDDNIILKINIFHITLPK
jgi:hypothetical protein